MFTGLIQHLGTLVKLDQSNEGVRIGIETTLSSDLKEGDSLAVDGVCLTATSTIDGIFHADLMTETLKRTTLGELKVGSKVNLELPPRAIDRLGGHLVQGHVDGVGTTVAREDSGFSRLVTYEIPSELMVYIVPKGSIAINGASLTVVDVLPRSKFTVSLIPETVERTNLGEHGIGDKVNIEVDVFAKYIEKLLAGRFTEKAPN